MSAGAIVGIESSVKKHLSDNNTKFLVLIFFHISFNGFNISLKQRDKKRHFKKVMQMITIVNSCCILARYNIISFILKSGTIISLI